MNVNNELAIIGRDIENAYQEVIINEGLVDTGRMLRSISVRIDVESFEIFLSIEDYFKFLDNKYKITEQVINHPSYIRAEKRLEILLEELIIEKFE